MSSGISWTTQWGKSSTQMLQYKHMQKTISFQNNQFNIALTFLTLSLVIRNITAFIQLPLKLHQTYKEAPVTSFVFFISHLNSHHDSGAVKPSVPPPVTLY